MFSLPGDKITQPRGCLYEKKLVPLSGLAHWDLGDMENLSYFYFAFSLKGEISVRGMKRNPYKHFSPNAEVNFNRGAHTYDLRIQTIIASVKSLTRHH